jgi:hypothetical protein
MPPCPARRLQVGSAGGHVVAAQQQIEARWRESGSRFSSAQQACARVFRCYCLLVLFTHTGSLHISGSLHRKEIEESQKKGAPSLETVLQTGYVSVNNSKKRFRFVLLAKGLAPSRLNHR